MKIRRQLRSARVSALTSEERREALLVAERALAEQGDPPETVAQAARAASPRPRAGHR